LDPHHRSAALHQRLWLRSLAHQGEAPQGKIRPALALHLNGHHPVDRLAARVEATALAIGILYPPSLLFLVGVLFLLLVAIGQSVTLSRLSESNQHLAQEVALLRKLIEDDRVQREKEREKEREREREKAEGGK